MRSRDTNQLPASADLVSVTDICRQFGVSHDWVYKWVVANAEQPLPFFRLGATHPIQKRGGAVLFRSSQKGEKQMVAYWLPTESLGAMEGGNDPWLVSGFKKDTCD